METKNYLRPITYVMLNYDILHQLYKLRILFSAYKFINTFLLIYKKRCFWVLRKV